MRDEHDSEDPRQPEQTGAGNGNAARETAAQADDSRAPSDAPASTGAGEEAKTPIYLDPATERGLTELLEKLAPLIQGRRLNNIIDLLSVASDLVDMSDESMINKLSTNFENVVSGAWAAGNAARYASNEVTQLSTPSMFGLLRAA